MRLSTEPDRDEGRAMPVLHAAFDAGVTLLDTADVYCRDDSEIGHNERLISRALKSWNGLPELQRALASGPARIVLDNTYATRKARAEVLRAAGDFGVAVHCRWLATDLDNAQVNAVTRLIEQYGRLPDEIELAALRKKDVNAFPPTVLFRYQRELEPPDPSEGFASIEKLTFERRQDPDAVNRGVIVWCDDPIVLPEITPALPDYARDGWKPIVLSWQPKVAEGLLTQDAVETSFARAKQTLGMDFDFAFCPHGAGPPRCWCRKPLPGLGVLMMLRHRIDPARSIFVGDGPQDAGFARKLGLEHRTRLDAPP